MTLLALQPQEILKSLQRAAVKCMVSYNFTQGPVWFISLTGSD